MKLRSVFLLIPFFVMYDLKSQQMPLYSQYMMNAFVFNPAMTGYDGYTAYNLTSRQQWLGIDNAPRTFSISAQTRILKRSHIIKTRINQANKLLPARQGKVGLGAMLYSDRNGSFLKTGLNVTYSYHISFPNAQLSFGITGSLTQYKVDLSSGAFRDKSEPLLAIGLNEPIYVPDANTGIHYMKKNFNIGLGIANLFQSYIKFGSQGLNAYRLKRTYYFTSKVRLNEGADFVYEPSILIKTTEQLFYQFDVSLKTIVRESYWFGMSYRSLNTIIPSIGLHYRLLWVGYAFDYQFSTLQRFTYGSHELFLSFKFGDSARRYRWVNRY